MNHLILTDKQFSFTTNKGETISVPNGALTLSVNGGETFIVSNNYVHTVNPELDKDGFETIKDIYPITPSSSLTKDDIPNKFTFLRDSITENFVQLTVLDFVTLCELKGIQTLSVEHTDNNKTHAVTAFDSDTMIERMTLDCEASGEPITVTEIFSKAKSACDIDTLKQRATTDSSRDLNYTGAMDEYLQCYLIDNDHELYAITGYEVEDSHLSLFVSSSSRY